MAKDKSVYDDLIDGGALTPQPDLVVPGEGRNKYDDLIERQASPLLKVVTDRGMVQDPEQAARILRVQSRMELPADLVERNLDELEQSMARNDFNPEGFRKTSPVVGAWLAERPEHLAISRDDLGRLARMEQLIAVSPKYRVSQDGGITETSEDGTQGFRYASAQEFYSTTFRGREVRQQIDAGERAARVADLATLGPLANVGAGFVSSLESTTDALRSIGGQAQPAGTVTAPVTQASQDLSPGIWGDLQRGVGGLAADVPLMLAGGPVAKGASTLLKLGRVRALLSTTALGTQGARTATGALLAGASVQPLAIREGINTGREHGLLNGLAAWGIETVVPAAFGRTGIQRALIPGVTPAAMAQRMGAARRFLTEAGLEGGEEVATEFVHAVHEATSGIDPDALEPDKLTRRLIVAGALGGLAGGAFNVPELVAEMGAGGGDVPGPRPALGKMPGILRGQNTKQFMQGLGEFATESEALKRSPDAVKALAAKMPETGRTTIYVDPQEFTAYAQSKRLDPRSFARLATAEFGVYEEAIATGAPMPIPVAQYVVALAGSEHHAALSAMARLSPGDPSVAESDAALETLKKPGEVASPEQRAAAQAAATQADAGADSLDDSALRIHEDVAKQLEAVGFTPEDAQVQATLYSEGFKTLGQRTGKDPFALFEPYRLRISRELPGVVQKGTADYTDTLLDRLRNGDIPKESAGRGESLGDYLRRKRGLQDQGGELSAMEVDAARKPGQSNLIQASGRLLDAAAQDAAEAGYIESPEPQALLDAIREEAAGRPVYMASTSESQEQATRDGLLELQEYLGRLGVDLKATDNPTVKKLLKEQEAKGGDGQTFAQGADLAHLSPEARAYVESLPAEPAVQDAIAASVAYLRIHPDLTGDKGNLQMVADFAKRRAAKGDQWRNGPFRHDSGMALEQDGKPDVLAIPPGMAVGYRMGAADVDRPSYNFQERRNEPGISMLRAVQGNGKDTHDRGGIFHQGKIHFYLGELMKETGSDGEPLLRPGTVREIGKKEFKEMAQAAGASNSADSAPDTLIGATSYAPSNDIQLSFASGAKFTTQMTGRGILTAERLEQIKREWQNTALENRHPVYVWSGIMEFGDGLGVYGNNGSADMVQLAAKGSGRTFNQPAYHGSQHKFDAFTTDHMGSGEGAQAYGWGLYFASKKKVGQYYREYLAGGAEITTESGKPLIYPVGSSADAAYASLESAANTNPADPWSDAIAEQQKMLAVSTTEHGKELHRGAIEQLAKWKSEGVQVTAKGRLYTVDIPEDGEYLLWDKPLNEQPAKVIALVEQLGLRNHVGMDVTSGEEIYSALKNGLGGRFGRPRFADLVPNWQAGSPSDKSASQLLLAAGIPGIQYLDGTSRTAGKGSFNYVIFDGADVAIRTYEQAARGQIQIAPDRTLSITLLRQANRSTFLHETGHLYLEVLGDLAAAPDATPEIKAMWADVLKWLQVSKRSEIGTPQHEQWAEGFETYLMRGTAPSTALRSAFARFRSWLMSIYKKLTNMRVQLSPEITRVFDRVLASDEAIATAQARQGTPATFTKAADAGMTPEQFAAYQVSVEAARVNAEDRLRAQLITAYEREATKQWKEERDALLATTADEINFRGEYQAIAAFQDGTLPDGRRLPDDLQGLRLSRQEIVALYGEDALMRLPGPKSAKRLNLNNSGRYIYSDNGISLAAGAKMFGFRDGQALFDALVNAPDRETLIEQTADKVMAETHPDPLTDGTLDERAALAMHNDLSAEVMINELRSLSQRTGQQAAPLELLRETARGLIARKLVKSLRPHRYEVAEGVAFRRVEEALAKGDHREAFIQKQKQLLNHELFRAAQQAVDAATQAYDYFKTFVEPKTRARIGKAGGWEWTVTYPDGATETVEDEAQAIALVKAKGGEWDQTSSYLDQIDGLLAQYEFKREAIKAAKRRDSLRAWVEKQGNDGSTVAISPSLLDQSRIINWKEMTVDQIAELKDAIQSIAHLATWKNKLMKASEQADFEEQRGAALVQLATLPQRKPAPRSGNATGLDRVSEKLDHLLANHRKLSSYARQMDGGVAGGTWWNLLVRPLNEAGDQEVTMRAEAAAAVKDLWTAWRKDGRHIKQVVTVPGVGPLTLETRLAVALNWGNDGNKERLLEGESWTAVQGQAVIDTLDATDWAVVQGTWDHINSYWSQIRSLEKRMNGVAPDKVANTPFIIQPKSPDGVAKGDPVVMRGGYYPVKYDHKRGARSGSQMQSAEALYELGSATAATTRRGHTKERTVGTGKPLRLDIDVIGQHVSQVVHDLSHREAVRDLRKVMLDDAVRQGIMGTLGEGALDMIDGTIRDVAVSDLADTATDQVYRKLRGGASIATMGFNFTSAAMQVTGVGQSMQLVGIGPFLRASGLVAANPADASRLINEQSSFMANRSKTALREVSEVMNQVKGGAWRDTMTRCAYMMMQECQRMVDMPTWLAAKENALIAGKSEADARAIADQAVIDSQGSGMTKDLAGVQRSRGPAQLFTVYYSYFGVTFQRLAESYATARGAKSAPEAVIQLMRDHLLLISIPAVLGVMIRSATKGGGDDEDKERPSLTARMLKEHIGMLTGTLTGVREFSDTIGTLAVTATLGKDEAKKFPVYGYGGPAGIMGLEAASTLLVQANQGEWDAGLAKAALRVAGVFGRLPTGQFIKTMEGLLDEEGPDLRSLLFGPPR